jgi:hypothetical protein
MGTLTFSTGRTGKWGHSPFPRDAPEKVSVPIFQKGECPLLVDGIRFRQGEGGDADVEALAGFGHHLIRAFHDPEWRCERATGGVLERLARTERRLLSDDTWTADFFDVPGAIGNHPVPCQKLKGLESFIQNGHRVEEEPLIFAGLRTVGGVFRLDSDSDGMGNGL